MASNTSLESLLQSLIDTPETEKRAVLHALLATLRETCALFGDSSAQQEIAKHTQAILDNILAVEGGQEWEEEFVESSSQKELQAETFTATEAKISIVQDSSDSPQTRITQLVNSWNKTASWLALPAVKTSDADSVIQFVRAAAAIRANILSNNFEKQTEYMNKFDKQWPKIAEALKEADYQIQPTDFSNANNGDGKIIYTCRTRITETEKELIAPGINFQGNTLLKPVWLYNLPIDTEFPADHPHAELPSHWRGILGETEHLLEQLQMQPGAVAAIEGINKNRIDPLDECLDNVIAEVTRRSEVLYTTIQKGSEETNYRQATDYWRVEECFWSVFHDDNRPQGASYFDRLRTRLQAWRTTLRRAMKFHIRDFACGSDSLASINQYIGNIIIQPKIKHVSPGAVIRELRPAIVVKDQGTSRLLKGRVIST